jgi:hypothetical protein
MLPSGRLFLNRDSVYGNRRARQRALWLYDDVEREVLDAPELRHADNPEEKRVRTAACPPSPFPPGLWGNEPLETKDLAEKWGVVAEVAEGYPRLLAWLTEGQASGYWNLFGAWVAVLRLIPGLRWIVWHYMFEPVAKRTGWRPALYEALLQARRLKFNQSATMADRTKPSMKVSGPGIPGLSAATDVAVIIPTEARRDIRSKIVNMSTGCIGVSGLRGAGKTTLIRDFCAHRYGTPLIPPPSRMNPASYLPGLRLMVEAPLRFNSREFLVHQYTCLCRAVLADVRFNPTNLRHAVLGPILLPRSIRPTALLGALSGVLLALLAAVLAYRATGHGWPVPPWGAHTWEAIGAVAAAIAGVVTICWRTRRALIEVRQIVNLAADAEARLKRLHFQRTDSRSQGGAIVGPLGTGLSVGTTQQFVEQTMTLPELIDDYRDFVERVVAALEQDWRNQRQLQQQQKRKKQEKERKKQEKEQKKQEKRRKGPSTDLADAAGTMPKEPSTDLADAADAIRLVIGIDAIDQIDDPREACKFLNDLSSVFGTPRCVYLVSVSPDALAAADPRMVPLKTSSGGIFDEMVWVDPLSLSDACELLDRRVTGFPAGFIALAYVLSGGLPRELLRIGRAIATAKDAQTAESGPDRPVLVGLADAARHVVEQEIKALKHRTLASAASLDVSATPQLLKLLTGDHWPGSKLDGAADCGPGPAHLDAILHEVSNLWDEVSSARQRLANERGEADPYTAEVCDSFLAGLFFLLTVRQLFTADPELVVNPLACKDAALPGDWSKQRNVRAKDWLNDNSVVLLNLARARIALGVSPYLAATLIADARHCLCTPDDPDFMTGIALNFLNPSREAAGPGEQSNHARPVQVERTSS